MSLSISTELLFSTRSFGTYVSAIGALVLLMIVSLQTSSAADNPVASLRSGTEGREEASVQVQGKLVPVGPEPLGDLEVKVFASADTSSTVTSDESFSLSVNSSEDTLRVQVDAASPGKRTFHPALLRTSTSELESGITVLMIPLKWQVQEGKYAGQMVDISMFKAFSHPEKAAGAYLDIFGGPREEKFQAAPKHWAAKDRPIPVVLQNLAPDQQELTSKDSTDYWRALEEMEDTFGRNLFRPAIPEEVGSSGKDFTGSIKLAVDSSGGNVFGVVGSLKDPVWNRPVPTSSRPWQSSSPEQYEAAGYPIKSSTVSITYDNRFGNSDASTLKHEILHAMGFGHGCLIESTMAYSCKSGVQSLRTTSVSRHDVAYWELRNKIFEVAKSHDTRFNILPALFGERSIMRGRKPIPNLEEWEEDPPPVAPSPPLSLEGSAEIIENDGLGARLDWPPELYSVAGVKYKVYRSTEPIERAPEQHSAIDTVSFVPPEVVTEYSDRAASRGSTYYYRVTAFHKDTGGESLFSPQVQVSLAEVTTTPSRLNFGFVSADQARTDTVFFENTGDKEVEGELGLNEDNEGFHIESGSGSYKLAPGQIMEILVSYDPEGKARHENRIEFRRGGNLIFTTRLTGVAAEGDGSEESPFEIETLQQLQGLTWEALKNRGVHFVQTNDIDADPTDDWNKGRGFDPIGEIGRQGKARFQGTYNGDGHSVSNLNIDRPTEWPVGLFGYLGRNGRVSNVDLKEVDIVGEQDVGGVVGRNNSGSVVESRVTGNVDQPGRRSRVGGLIGDNTGNVKRSRADAQVSGRRIAGGLVGANWGEGRIQDSYAEGTVTSSKGFVDGPAGGLVGENRKGARIDRAYAVAEVSGGKSGGLVGVNEGTVDSSYWGVEATGQISGIASGESGNIEGLAAAEMTGGEARNHMSKLGFGKVWAIVEEEYPALRWPTAEQTRVVNASGEQAFEGSGLELHLFGLDRAGSVTVQKYDDGPDHVDGIEEGNVSRYRFMVWPDSSLSFDSTDVQLHASRLGGMENPEKVTVYARSSPGSGPFSELPTSYDSEENVLVATAEHTGEFVLASKTEPLPIELERIEATVDGDAVRLSWSTASETGNSEFQVQRRKDVERNGGESTWTTVGAVEGRGTTSQSQSYRFADEDLPYEADALTYRLRQVDTDGSASYTDPVAVERSVDEMELLSTYPNPARGQATIRYALPERQEVSLKLYDMLGRKVRTIAEGKREGRNGRQVDVSGLPSGAYFLRLQAGGKTRTQRLTVVR